MVAVNEFCKVEANRVYVNSVPFLINVFDLWYITTQVYKSPTVDEALQKIRDSKMRAAEWNDFVNEIVKPVGRTQKELWPTIVVLRIPEQQKSA